MAYSRNHARMADPNTPSCDKNEQGFAKQGGITNGAAWYSVEGGKKPSTAVLPFVSFLYRHFIKN